MSEDDPFSKLNRKRRRNEVLSGEKLPADQPQRLGGFIPRDEHKVLGEGRFAGVGEVPSDEVDAAVESGDVVRLPTFINRNLRARFGE